MNYKIISLVSLISFFLLYNLFSQKKQMQDTMTHQASENYPLTQEEELGKVNWLRDYDEALALAQEENKDVLILFQEVPGCATCRNYGHNVLSHPLMVEAIENSFVPLAIFNNKGGKDKEILEKYKEPSWNNPVVRIVDVEEQNVVPRISNDYSAATLSLRMKQALVLKKEIVPEYLNLLVEELTATQANRVDEKYFKMYCFWTGEKELGKLDGVLSTQSGFMNYSEVVKVNYDSRQISESELEKAAARNNFKPIDKGSYKLAANDLHYYLQHTDYKYLPLTELQKTKINSLLGNNKPGEKYLSPTQKKWLAELRYSTQKNTSLVHTEFAEAWAMKEALNK